MRPPDLDRYASALAPDVAFVDHRTVGFASGRGADKLLRGFRSLFELADELTTRVEDVLRLEPDAVLLRWTTAGMDRVSGAFESEFLLLWVFGPDGRVVHDETFDASVTAGTYRSAIKVTSRGTIQPRRLALFLPPSFF